jgi:LytS/YehU family sensor histidine kinase
MAYNRQGRYKEGLAKAEELIQVATEKGRPDKQVRGYRMKYDALYGLGNYKEAVEWLEKSVVLSDSIKATENAASLQNLLVKYETEKKEEELRRITTETELKDLLIQKRNIQLMAGGVGVFTLMVLAFLMFRSYRIKNEFELLDLKQRFYRAQINPHFLFNAISSVQGFFYDRTDPNKAAGYLSRLSKLMRQILENTFDNEVTLAEEVTLMENYLEIQKVRLSDRFDYEVRVDEELGDILIPSMITQPFLENSVEHGFKELTDRKGHIVISAAETNGMVQIRIEDNGTGISDNGAKSDHRSRAMDITRERLRLLEKTKGKKARFEVVDNKTNGGQGVTVLIDLPA